MLDNGNASDGKFDTIDVYTLHGFQEGDQVAFIQGDSQFIGLTDGEVYTVRLLDLLTTTLELPETKLQLLDSNGDLVELDAGTSTGTPVFGSLVNLSPRVSISTGNDSVTPLYLNRDPRIAIEAPASSTGSEAYALRLTLDPSTTVKDNHGFAPPFDPSTAVTDADGDGNLDTIDLGYAHNFITGQAVTYTSGFGNPIVGLSEDQVYYVVPVSETEIQLAENLAQALIDADSREVVQFLTSTTTNTGHAIATVLRPVAAVDGPEDTINLGRIHGLANGDQVVYRVPEGGTAIGGLTDGTSYTVVTTDDPQVFQLSSALDGSQIVDLDPAVAAGAGHRFDDLVAAGLSQIDASGDVGVASANSGTIVAVTVAGTVAMSNKTNSFTGAGWSAKSTTKSKAEKFIGGGKVSGTLAINVQVDRTFAYVQDATINAADLCVEATNDTGIFVGAGAVTYASVDAEIGGGSGSIAGAVSVTVMASRTEAYVDDSTISLTGDLQTEADARGNLVNIALGGTLSTAQLAAAGSIAINVISLNTLSYISDSVVTSTGGVEFYANNNADAVAISGAFAGVNEAKNAQADSTSALGFAIGVNVISNDLRDGGTLAYVEDSRVDAGGDLIVVADTQSSIIIMTVAGALNMAGTGAAASVAVSFGLNVISTRTRASIRGKNDDEGFDVGGDVRVQADDTSTASALNFAGAVATSNQQNTVAAGAGLMFNVIATDIQADITVTTVISNNVDVHATSDGDVLAAAVGFAGAEGNAIAGQFGLNYTQQEVIAGIQNSTIDSISGDVNVHAINSSTIQALTGGGALGWSSSSGTGVGAALSFNITNDTTEATIDASTVTASDGGVVVEAIYTATVETITTGVAIGKQVGVAGSLSTVVLTNETQATITNSFVDADRNILVHGDQDGVINTIAGAAGFSQQSVGLGGGISISVLTNEVRATIEDSTIHARANDGVTVQINDWYDPDQADSAGGDAGDETTETISGLAVVASSSETLQLYSGTVGFSSNQAGVGVNLAPHFVSDTVRAYIADSDVNSDADHGGDIIVKAHQQTDVSSVIGAAGVSFGTAGVGIAAEGLFVSNDTQAYITDTDTSDGHATLYSGGDVEVSSTTRETASTVVVGLAAASSFAGAGAVDFLTLNNTNKANISEVNVHADGDLSVLATNIVDYTPVIGNAAGSNTAAGGGSFLVMLNNNQTEASMSGAVTNARGDTLVHGWSVADIDAVAVVVGAGVKGSFMGSFSFYVSETTTRAVIEGGSRAAEVNLDSSYDHALRAVTVRAIDDVTTSQVTGAPSASIFGALGGALSYTEIENTVDAHIGSFARVSAQRDVIVSAESSKDITGGSGGLGVALAGLAGSFTVASLGSGVSTDAFDAIGGETRAATNDALGAVLSDSGLSASATPNAVREQFDTHSASLNDAGTQDRFDVDVVAYIGEEAQITAGGDLEVTALETIAFGGIDIPGGAHVTAGALALGGATFGASLTSLKVFTATEAFIDDNAIVAVGDDLTVSAHADETGKLVTLAGSGGAGLVVGIQYSEALISSSQSAVIDSGVQVLQADAVSISAGHSRDMQANSTGGALSLAYAAGVSAAEVKMDGTVQAGLGSGARFGTIDDAGNPNGTIGSLTIDTFSQVTRAKAEANAVAGGIISGAGTDTDVLVNPAILAGMGQGNEVYTSGAINITGRAEMDALAQAWGLNVATVATAGISVADAEISPTLTTVLGDDNSLRGDSITIESLFNTSRNGTEAGGQARVQTTASGGALFVGVNGTWAKARSEAVVDTNIGASSLQATRLLTVQARSHNDGDTDTDGNSGGIVGVGVQRADTYLTTNTGVTVGDNAYLRSTTSNVVVRADSSEYGKTDGLAGSGGAVGVSDVRVGITANNTTTVSIGAAELRAAGTVRAHANMRSTLDADADAGAFGGVAVPTTEATIDLGGSGGITGDAALIEVRTEGALLRADSIELIAEVERIDADARTQSFGGAIFSDAHSTSETLVETATEVIVGAGSRLEGGDNVDLIATQHDLRLDAEASSDINMESGSFSVSGVAYADALSNLEARGRVITEGAADALDASRISTQILNAEVDIATPDIDGDPDANAPFLGNEVTGPSNPEVVDLDRIIRLDGDIYLVTESPLLEIDADGNVLAQEGVTFTDDGSTITVDDIQNAGDLAGEINLGIDATNFDGDDHDSFRSIQGSGNLVYQTGFNRVTIEILADRDVELGAISVVNDAASVSSLINKPDVDSDTLSFTSESVEPGETIITVESAGDLSLAGKLTNEFGQTFLSAFDDLGLTDNGVEVHTATLDLTAVTGSIGSSGQRFRTRGALDTAGMELTANAEQDIWQRGLGLPISIVSVQAGGDVDISADRSILDGGGDDLTPDISASRITLRAGSIGSSGALEIDTNDDAALRAFANGDIRLTEIDGALTLQHNLRGSGKESVHSVSGDIELTVIDAIASGQNLSVGGYTDEDTGDSFYQSIRANNGNVSLMVGDDFTLAEGGRISGADVSIAVDQTAVDFLDGGAITLAGTLSASSSLTLSGGDDGDSFDIQTLAATTPLTIVGGAGGDDIRLGSAAGTLGGLLLANIFVDAGDDADDSLTLDDSGSVASRTLTLRDSTEAGYEGQVAGYTGNVHHKGLDELILNLGSGDDMVSVQQSADSVWTRLNLGGGDDSERIGVDNSLAGILGKVSIEGEAGVDSIDVDNSAVASDTDGTLARTSLTGFGMGDADAGLAFGTAEQMRLSLGDGANILTLLGVGLDTDVSLGAGNDTLVVSGTFGNFDADITVDGGADTDLLSLSFDQSTSFTLDATTIRGGAANGTVGYANLESVQATLSDAPDVVTIDDATPALTLDAGGGADLITVNDLSVATSIHLGADNADDQIIVVDTSAPLQIEGLAPVSGGGVDTLTMDRSATTAAVAGSLQDTASGVLSGVTGSDITVDGITVPDLLLGTGNDVLSIDVGVQLLGTQIRVDGGDGDDRFTVLEIVDSTVIAGGNNDDTVEVFISGTPTANQFAGLRLDVEVLNVDNSSNPEGVAWSLIDGQLGADLDDRRYSEAILEDNPFAYYRLNESSGTTAANLGSLGSVIDGTYNNVAGFQLESDSLLPSGSDVAVAADGSDGAAGTVDAEETELRFPGHGQMTSGTFDNKSVSLWFSADSITATPQVLFEQGGAARGMNLFVEEVAGVDRLFMGAWNLAESNWGPTYVSAPINEGEIYHAVLVLEGNPDADPDTDDGFIRGYLNGELFQQTAGAGQLRGHTLGALFGVHSDSLFPSVSSAVGGVNDGFNFAGTIDELALFNTALTDSQIADHFMAAADTIDVLTSTGAEKIRILAGSGNDTLDLGTETATDAIGRIDGNRVELDFGTVVLAPEGLTTFAQPQIAMNFDGFLNDASRFSQNGLVLESDGSMILRDGALGTAGGENRLTLSAENNGVFDLVSMEVQAIGAGSHKFTYEFRFVGSDEWITEERFVEGDLGLVELSLFGDQVEQVRWTLPENMSIGNIVVEPKERMTFDDIEYGLTSYTEGNFTVTNLDGKFTAFDYALAVDNDTSPETVRIARTDGQAFSLAGLILFHGDTAVHQIQFTGISAVDGSEINLAFGYTGDPVNFQRLPTFDLQNVTEVRYEHLDGLYIGDMLFDPLADSTSPATLEGTLAVQNGDSYTEDRLTLTAAGSLAADNSRGPAVTGASDGELLTLTASDGGGFAFFGLDLINTSDAAQTLNFVPTTLNGTELDPIVVSVPADRGRFHVDFTDLNAVLSSLHWANPAGVAVDNILAASRVSAVIDFNNLDSGSGNYNEDGFFIGGDGRELFRTDGQLHPSGKSGGQYITFAPQDGGLPTLESLVIDDTRGGDIDQTWLLTGTRANGETVTEQIRVNRQDAAQRVTVSNMVDVSQVTLRILLDDANYTRIDDVVLSQGYLNGVEAVAGPTAVTPADTSATAQSLVFHTGGDGSEASLSVDDAAVTSLNNTAFGIQYLDATGSEVADPVAGELYIARFVFHGDLFIPDDSSIQVTGLNALSLFVENNATLGANLSFDLSGESATIDDNGTPDDTSDDFLVAGQGGPGGGAAGGGGDGGAGAEGGNGLKGGDGGDGGHGGAGVTVGSTVLSYPGERGHSGGLAWSISYDEGLDGSDGADGGAGFNGGVGGIAGSAGLGGDSSSRAEQLGGRGAGGAESGVDAFYEPVSSNPGEDGRDGSPTGRATGDSLPGEDGAAGTAGGGGQNLVTGTLISGGGGGAGGGGGGGGGGGQGADGGAGGVAGTPGEGGRNRTGGYYETSLGGNAGDEGQDGYGADINPAGSDGTDHSGSFSGLGDGGSGGAGGDGGAGGHGGAGGDGGAAGGGAGGTIKLFASKLSIATDGEGNATVTVDTAGGQGTIDASVGGNGRILLGSNDSDQSDELIVSSSVLDAGNYYDGPRAENPFTFTGAAESTRYIPDLIGGAQVYGLLDLDGSLDYKSVLDFDLNSAAQDDAPADALVAVYRVDSGFAELLPGDQTALDFRGFDTLLVINLTDLNLAVQNFGVHLSDSADASDSIRLGYDGLADDGYVALDALNAGAVWATLVPEVDLSVTTSVNGQVNNLADTALAVGEVAYITSSRGLVVEEGAGSRGVEIVYTFDDQGNRVANSVQVGTLVDFSGLTEIVQSRGGGRELYALSQDRDALLVIDSETLELRQVIENSFDGVSLFEDARNLFTSADGLHVYAQVNDEQLAIFERNENTRMLAFSAIQIIDYEIPGNLFFDADNYTLQHFVLSEWFDTAVAHITFDSDPGDGDDTQAEEVLKAFARDPDTGLFTALTKSDPLSTTERVEYNPDRAGAVDVHDIALIGDDLYILQEDLGTGETDINQLFVGFPSPGANLFFGTGGDADGAAFGFNGATELAVIKDTRLYALDPEGGKITVMDWEALGGLTLLSSV